MPKKLVILALLGLFCVKAYADKPVDVIKLSRAIYTAEGGDRARFLYGIRSCHYKDKAEAERICIRTIRHRLKTWKGGDFITYLGSIYCPVKGPLSFAERRVNRNWVKNVKYFYERGRP